VSDIMTLHSPADWSVYRLGQLFRERKEKGSDSEFPPLSVTMRGIVPQLETAAKSDDGDNRKIVRVGDYVINSRSDRKGSGGISDYEGSVSLISIVLQPRDIDSRFTHHLLRSPAFQEEFYRWGHGIVADLWTTRYADMKNIRLHVPDLPTQRAIANFLDRETARIDLLVEKKKRLVALLGEKRSAIVNAAVTGQAGFEGVDGVRLQLRRVVTLRNAKTQFDDSLRPYIGLEHIASWTGEIMNSDNAEPEGLVAHFSKGDILFGKLRPYLAKIASPNFKGVCSTEVLVLRPEKRIEGRFLHYTLASSGFIDRVNAATYGAKMPRANWENIGTEIIWVPDHSTQLAIADLLDRKTTQIEKIQEAKQRSIDRLKEYRSALITAAVTGQINVAEWSKTGTNERQLDAIQAEIAH
jgi:type I restriction enzyme S subunit